MLWMIPLLRRALLVILLALFAAWATEEATQQFLRWRAQRLLTGIRSLDVNHRGWPGVQSLIATWNRWGSHTPAECDATLCNYRIDLVATLPSFLAGTPGSGSNWLARLAGNHGLRSAAARGGFTIENGVVISKWFGEQVTLPVSDWGSAQSYIPYLSALSDEDAKFREHTRDAALPHPNRFARAPHGLLLVSFSPNEDPTEKSALMDFQLACITRLRPCTQFAEILPAGARALNEK